MLCRPALRAALPFPTHHSLLLDMAQRLFALSLLVVALSACDTASDSSPSGNTLEGTWFNGSDGLDRYIIVESSDAGPISIEYLEESDQFGEDICMITYGFDLRESETSGVYQSVGDNNAIYLDNGHLYSGEIGYLDDAIPYDRSNKSRSDIINEYPQCD